MQRSEKEIKEREEIEHILEEAEIGRLGTCSKGEPYVVPLSFAYRDGKIMFHCARRGKKLDNIAKNPRVCFEVDTGEVIPAEKPCDFSYSYRSVIAYGEARVYTNSKKMVEALKLLVDKYAPSGMSGQLTEGTVSKYDNLAVVEITVNEMTGKKSSP
jgi:nitroimidazol reductase NimA-like FMN-containing flavoprotein (pyridoxamine 5'-phosphate oxidase superfamily)